jgi:hypothetical protein
MDLNTLKEYLNIHLISLRQDMEQDFDIEYDYHYLSGQIASINHILEYINER